MEWPYTNSRLFRRWAELKIRTKLGYIHSTGNVTEYNVFA